MEFRRALFLITLVLSIVFAVVAAILAIVYYAAKETPVELVTEPTTQVTPNYESNWWKRYPIYQVYPRSFQDSDGDGIGDLNGIKSRLDYFTTIGIKTIWLNPIYQSPQYDMGYDISNYTAIDPTYGTMSDFEQLVQAVHDKDMYIILDFVPNHSSFEHPWFRKSRKGEALYKNYYVWKNAEYIDGQPQPPNNWLSVFGNSSWEWVPERNQYYLHQFLIEQPDLNYRDKDVRKDIIDTFQFWMDKGVDGFRVDAVIFLIENDTFPNEPIDPAHQNDPENDYDYLKHIYTKDQQETYDIVKDWTKLFSEYGLRTGKHIFMVTEGYTDTAHVMKYYTTGVDFPFNFNLIQLTDQTTAFQLRTLVADWMNNMPKGHWPNWVVGNHDNHRIGTKMGGRQYTDVMNMLLLLLPGTPTCYYGDEIGMTDTFVSYKQTKDTSAKKWGPELYLNFTRDPERTPMQWNNGSNAGFSTSTNGTWLPINDNYKQGINVEYELNQERTHLKLFKQLLQLRLLPSFQANGENIKLLDTGSENLFAFARFWQDYPSYLICINIGHGGDDSQLILEMVLPYTVEEATLILTSTTIEKTQYEVGQKFQRTQSLKMNNGQGLVLKFYG